MLLTCAAVSGTKAPALARDPALSHEQLVALLKAIDDHQGPDTDWCANLEIAYTRKADVVARTHEGEYCQRPGKIAILFETQRTTITSLFSGEQSGLLSAKPDGVVVGPGGAYLYADDELWHFAITGIDGTTGDPARGKWERPSDDQRIAGSSLRLSDLKGWRLASAYQVADEGEEMIGTHQARRLKLTADPRARAPFPTTRIWVDQRTKNVLKRHDFGVNGHLVRTIFYLKWATVFRGTNPNQRWYPEETRLYDEGDEANETVLKVWHVDVQPRPSAIFTREWLQGRRGS